jgi:hypothetical protein
MCGCSDGSVAGLVRLQRLVGQNRCLQGSTLTSLPKMAEAPTQPLMNPRLFPIWNRPCPAWIAFTM